MATNASKSTIVKRVFGAQAASAENLNILTDVDKIYGRSTALDVSNKAQTVNMNKKINDFATKILNKIKAAAEAGKTVAYYELTDTDKDSSDMRSAIKTVMYILNNTEEKVDAEETKILDPNDPTNKNGIPYKINNKIAKDKDLFGYSIKAQKKINDKYTSTTNSDSIINIDRWGSKDVDRFVISWGE